MLLENYPKSDRTALPSNTELGNKAIVRDGLQRARGTNFGHGITFSSAHGQLADHADQAVRAAAVAIEALKGSPEERLLHHLAV
jgi:hypothetical protein